MLRQQRHTGVRIFQRLRDEHQFTVGQRTVLACVQKRRGEMELERPKIHKGLEHPLAYIQTASDVFSWEYKRGVSQR